MTKKKASKKKPLSPREAVTEEMIANVLRVKESDVTNGRIVIDTKSANTEIKFITDLHFGCGTQYSKSLQEKLENEIKENKKNRIKTILIFGGDMVHTESDPEYSKVLKLSEDMRIEEPSITKKIAEQSAFEILMEEWQKRNLSHIDEFNEFVNKVTHLGAEIPVMIKGNEDRKFRTRTGIDPYEGIKNSVVLDNFVEIIWKSAFGTKRITAMHKIGPGSNRLHSIKAAESFIKSPFVYNGNTYMRDYSLIGHWHENEEKTIPITLVGFTNEETKVTESRIALVQGFLDTTLTGSTGDSQRFGKAMSVAAFYTIPLLNGKYNTPRFTYSV